MSSDPVLDVLVFGTDDQLAIDGLITRWCDEQFGTSAASTLFAAASVGVVTGVELADGRRVVIKAFQPRWTEPFLGAVARAQRHLAASGFPCPVPVAGPVKLGTGWALAETFVADPGHQPLHARMLAVAAAGLAEQVARCREVDGAALEPHPLDTPSDGLYPVPHNPIFDFAATASGAEWIDELAAVARTVRASDASAPVIAHGDWSARNVRLRDDHIAVAYDWDSLCFVPESIAVGQASVAWRATGEETDERAPAPDEASAFVDAYEHARGEPLTDETRRAVGASALWMLAYSARCEHALDRLGGPPHRWARDRLAVDGRAFLAVGQ